MTSSFLLASSIGSVKRHLSFLSLLLCLAVMLTLAPAVLPQRAAAAWSSGDWLETAKDRVPLRDKYGQDYDIKGYISKKGTAVQITDIKEYKPHWYTIKPHIWYKVRVTTGVSGFSSAISRATCR